MEPPKEQVTGLGNRGRNSQVPGPSGDASLERTRLTTGRQRGNTGTSGQSLRQKGQRIKPSWLSCVPVLFNCVMVGKIVCYRGGDWRKETYTIITV
jgi:hypothetical protein